MTSDCEDFELARAESYLKVAQVLRQYEGDMPDVIGLIPVSAERITARDDFARSIGMEFSSNLLEHFAHGGIYV